MLLGSDLCYYQLVTKYGKIVSNSSVQHDTHEASDQKLKELLDQKNFVVPGKGFAGMFLKDIDDLVNNFVNDCGGIIHEEDHTPSQQ
jgi:hypothetical protein